MGKWMCEIGGQRKGPFGDQQLQAMARDGTLVATDKIWNPSGKRWELAGRLPGLFAGGAAGRAAGGNGAAAAAASDAASAALAGAAVAVAANDAGPFYLLGESFKVKNGSEWTGRVVASHAALYLLKGEARQSVRPGALAATALDNFDDVRSCRVGDLPDHVRKLLDPKSESGRCDAIVLPKDAVTRVQAGLLGGTLTVQCGGDTFDVVFGSASSAGGAKSFLEGGGWVIGEPVRPTAPAVHGHGFGRAAGEKSPSALSGPERIVYAVGAVAVFLLIAFVKFQLRRGRNGW